MVGKYSHALFQWISLILVIFCCVSSAFVNGPTAQCRITCVASNQLISSAFRSADGSKTAKYRYKVFDTSEAVGQSMCDHIVDTAKREIAAKGSFNVAVPGGSAVKLLKFLKPRKNDLDWSKVNLFYVNHKCVPDDDPSATHFKARGIFLDEIGGIKAYVPDATAPSAADRAARYADTLRRVVPMGNNFPRFDLVVLGMGKDGHIGSLYPGRNEVNEQTAFVLPVDKKDPPSVTLTLPVFNNAKDILLVVTSDDKAEAAQTAICQLKSKQDFPVCGVRTNDALWLIDTPCAKLL